MTATGDTGGGFDRLWGELAPIGRNPETGGYRRFAWTGADATLREWFAGAVAARGLALTLDRAGNQWAWWGDPDADGPGLVLGSHLDSVPDGGAFDGPLGIVSALLTLDALRETGFRPSVPIGLVNFGDEEGARFGVACAGSRVITGALRPSRAARLTDADGVQLAAAMSRAGLEPAHLGRDDETLRRIGTFIELHVEQGRGLVELERPVALASAIRPHGRWRADLPGTANHAGTTRLEDRHDALLALADLIQETRISAERHAGVATCGRVDVRPNGVNAIPSHATAWLDARAATAGQVQAMIGELRAVVSRHRGTLVEESWTDVTTFAPDLAAELAGLLDGAPVLATGAGHDAGILAAAGVRAAMLFVRNPTGVSHSPAEHAERDDCLAGVLALTRVVEHLAGS